MDSFHLNDREKLFRIKKEDKDKTYRLVSQKFRLQTPDAFAVQQLYFRF